MHVVHLSYFSTYMPRVNMDKVTDKRAFLCGAACVAIPVLAYVCYRRKVERDQERLFQSIMQTLASYRIKPRD
jgi:hypothetical protein